MQIEITLSPTGHTEILPITIAVDPDTYDRLAAGAAYEFNLRFVAPETTRWERRPTE